ncbi:MAG: CXXX repeat peptide maturase [Bacteroidaceae bacterium]|nr:CXXX repeat peptide maturase [Bacteroidaceae bacterium]
MLQYLNILLDDSAVSFCHYEAEKKQRLMSIDMLKAGIRFAMMENLMIQFVFPDSPLPKEYYSVIDSIDHFNIKRNSEDSDVCVVENWDFSKANANVPIVVRTTKEDFFQKHQLLNGIIAQAKRINIIITNVNTFNNDDFKEYKGILDALREQVERVYIDRKSPQLNLLTDRMMLKEMNNCGAGDTNITLAPNGKFYVCPAFYYEDKGDSIGDLEQGLEIRNKQLYKLECAPICRHCDAFQCKRCIWLNRKATLEVNTPSHEQCVLAHLERNASRDLLHNIRKLGSLLSEQEDINELDYLDPFDKRDEWQ